MEGGPAPKSVPVVLDQTAELLQGTFTTFLNEYVLCAAASNHFTFPPPHIQALIFPMPLRLSACRFRDAANKRSYLEQIGHMCRNDQKTLYLDFKDVLNFEASGRAGALPHARTRHRVALHAHTRT
jgi:hypothetical protein